MVRPNKEPDPHEHRKSQTHGARLRLLGRRQFTRKNRNENHAVDPENDLEAGQRQERELDMGVQKPFHGYFHFLSASSMTTGQ
jgi:hypothetical protein